MIIAAFFTVAKIWKLSKCPSLDKWIEKVWYMYTMEYYWAIKKNEVLPLVIAWIDLKGIVLDEINKTEKGKYHMISFVYRILKIK